MIWEMFRRDLGAISAWPGSRVLCPILACCYREQEPEPLLLKVDLAANRHAAEFVKSQQPDDDTEERTRKRKSTALADGIRMSRRADYNALPRPACQCQRAQRMNWPTLPNVSPRTASMSTI